MKIVEITYRYDADAGVTPVGSRPVDAQAAVDRLNAGNRAFGKLLDDLSDDMGTGRRIIEVDPRDLGFVHQGEDAAPTQRPYAAVLGCSDARVPIELIFNEGPNDLFVVRASRATASAATWAAASTTRSSTWRAVSGWWWCWATAGAAPWARRSTYS